MTNQEIMDQIYRGLKAQGAYSGYIGIDAYNNPKFYCSYVDPEGRKCAAGQIIPSELYTPEMENKTWTYLYSTSLRCMNLSREQVEIIGEAQDIHDLHAADKSDFDFMLTKMLDYFKEQGYDVCNHSN